MKLVVSSDWHLDWHTDGYERFQDVADAVMKVAMHAIGLKQQGEDVVFVFLGDLTNPYSRNVHRACAYAIEIADWLSQACVDSVFLVGNHDVIEDGHGSHTLMGLKHMPKTRVIDKPGGFWVHGKYFIGLPFTPTSHTYDPVAVVEAEVEYVPHVIMGHLSIEGILRVGSETTDMPRGRDVIFPVDAARKLHPDALLLNGHYHKQQVFNHVHIPGSLVRLTHGEEVNDPGFLVVDV